MPKKDLFEEKLALVYEYNRKSPLFVRAAGIEIEKNNLHKAVSILNGGLAEYPNYPTAYILLGKAQMMLGSFEEAEESFKKGASLIHSKETLNYYISELEKRRRKSSNLESRRVSFFDEEHSTELSNKANDIPSKDESTDQASPSSIEERLDDLAKEISSAKISLNPEEPIPGMEGKTSEEETSEDATSAIASETLAKIYISQGKFSEALAIYKILLSKSPDRKDFYQSKIEEIEQQLGQSGW
ncbi:MAG TPA: tetratricopeptide repeat protein [Ignavibacteriales bacterium]|nr:tetratricopeptide repeat protein [Ignavibacteriales bacterium]